MSRALLLPVLFALAVMPVGLRGQEGRQVEIIAVALTADTVGFGDAFGLLLDLSVPAGRTVRIPAVLPAFEGVEGLGRVEWTSEPAEGGGSTVSIRYALLPYLVGNVDTPEFAILSGPAVPPSDGGTGPDPVAVFDLDAGEPDVPGSSRLLVRTRRAWVNSILTLEDAAQGLEPRPADDVIGPSWSAPAIFGAFAFASLLLGIAFVSGRDLVVARTRDAGSESDAAVDSVEAARRAALARLDELLERGLPTPEEADRFYAASSGAVRSYVEHLEQAWGPAYTSTELMRDLEARVGREALDALLGEMRLAEVVKFGRLRPDPDAALEHCRTLRAWVAES